jgi:oxygen-independent coproporphyrinogen-3 oxidase
MRDALLKYATAEVPRYTSYPTAAQFHTGIDEATCRGWLAGIGKDDRLSVYLHVPFCHQLCWYCGCHTTIVHDYDRVAAYVKALHAEIDLLADAVLAHGGVAHIHFGGGTPTLLENADFAGIVDALRTRLGFREGIEIAVEADPRTLTNDRAKALAAAGVTRASLGVQDFSPGVQERINRIQPICTVTNACQWLRAAGIEAVNFDLMYGLPGQTVANVEGTATLAASLHPDRIAVFGYAHVPWFKKHQRVFEKEELPDLEERFAQAEAIGDTLEARGYAPIGFDHYAQPDDSLAQAAAQGILRRNFQGYTDDAAPVLIGLGASAIGAHHQGYVQNTVRIDDYCALLSEGHLPAVRGVALTEDDRLRREAIERILCDLALDAGALCAAYGRAEGALDDAFEGLRQLQADGLVDLDGRRITVLPEGRRFLRNVAVCFDAYWMPREARHSVAV